MPPGNKHYGLNTEVGNGWHRMWGTRWLLCQHSGRQRPLTTWHLDRDLQQMVSRGRDIENSRRTHRVQEVEGAYRKTWARSMLGREPAGRPERGACTAVWGHSSGLWETQSDSGEACLVQTLKYEKHIFTPNNSMVNSRALFWSQKYLKITPFFYVWAKWKREKLH